jgi:hypothetical protein
MVSKEIDSEQMQFCPDTAPEIQRVLTPPKLPGISENTFPNTSGIGCRKTNVLALCGLSAVTRETDGLQNLAESPYYAAMSSYAHTILNSLGWRHTTPEDRPNCAKFTLSLPEGEIPATAEGLTDPRTIILYLHFAMVVPDSKRPDIARLLLKINNNTAMGFWCLDVHSGSIWYRMTITGDTKDDVKLFRSYVEDGCRVFMEWQKCIAVAITEEMGADKAFFIKHALEGSDIAGIIGKYRP